MLVEEKFSLLKNSCLVHTRSWAPANDAKIVRSGDAQRNTEESP